MSDRAQLDSLSKDELINIILSLQKEVLALRNELEKYKNSNTPPSSNKHLKPDTRGKNKGKGKKGAPKGHPGTTRNKHATNKEVIDAD